MVNVKKICAILLGCAVISNHAAVYDNRFFPHFARPYIAIEGRCNYLSANAFFTNAGSAWDDNERDVTIASLFAKKPGTGPDAFDPESHKPGDRASAFDLSELGDALTIAGYENPLRSAWRGQKIEYHILSKIESQGADFSLRRNITHWLSVGLQWYFMRVHSRQKFILGQNNLVGNNQELPAGDVIELDETRRKMNQIIGLDGCSCTETGSGDTDVFVRFGRRIDHKYKMRTIDLGFTLGWLFPTGKKQDTNNAASVPFGGNGHHGWYIQPEIELEIKEDWKFGAIARISKRLEKTQLLRVPVAKEHPLFGALVANIEVDPGFTGMVVPYVCFENLREGFGARMLYYMRWHESDSWQDARADRTIPLNLTTMNGEYEVTESRSEWASEYLSLNIFYDFGKTKVCRGYEPIVSLVWDIPVVYAVSENIPKTHRVSLGVEINF